PGSMPPDSTCLADEGVLIRPTKLIDAGVSREDELLALLRDGPFPSRSPEENLADLRAQVAANNAGVRELMAMSQEIGFGVVAAYMKHIREASAAKMLQCLRSFAEAAPASPHGGDYRFVDCLDDGSLIAVRISIHEGGATFDFAGSADVNP